MKFNKKMNEEICKLTMFPENSENMTPDRILRTIDTDVPMSCGAKSPSRIQEAIIQALKSTVTELLHRQNYLEQRVLNLESFLKRNVPQVQRPF